MGGIAKDEKNQELIRNKKSDIVNTVPVLGTQTYYEKGCWFLFWERFV